MSRLTIGTTTLTLALDLNIDVHTLAEVLSVEGDAGDFKVKVKLVPRYVDADKCTGCGDCEVKCPKKVPSEFEQKLGLRKAVYSLFPQAVPNTRAIDASQCLCLNDPDKKCCRLCEKACKAGAINYEDKGKEIELNVGSIILSPGLDRYDARVRQELGLGRWQNVVSSIQLERILSASGPYKGEVKRPSDGRHPKKVAWIQCVGSRDCSIGAEDARRGHHELQPAPVQHRVRTELAATCISPI